MKVRNLKLKNFTKFLNYEIEFDGKVTRLVGVNGSGKTTIGLTAIWAGLKGIVDRGGDKLIGERWRFIASGTKAADIEITLIDEKRGGAEILVRNHITPDGNNISFRAQDGYELDNKWLDNLLSVAFLSAKHFCAYDGVKQALLMGIDVREFDEKLNELKADYTILNREYKAFGDVVPPAEPEQESVSVETLLAEKKAIDEKNELLRARKENRTKAKTALDAAVKEKQELLEKINLLDEKIAKANDFLQRNPEPEPLASDADVMSKIANAQTINESVSQWKAFREKAAAKEAKAKELEENDAAKEQVKADRLSAIQAASFGVDGLGVDDDGGLTYQGRPIREPYFSKGELELLVARLYMAKNPELKVRFIDEFQSLDAGNQETLLNELLALDFQVIVGEVSNSSSLLVIREGKEPVAEEFQ